MNELVQLEAMLRARPASLSNEQRRAAYDALGDLVPLAADVQVEAVVAHGVPAEWTSTPSASTSEVILYLHGGGYAYWRRAGRQSIGRDCCCAKPWRSQSRESSFA
jgi:epsilon-lactone hydrolase